LFGNSQRYAGVASKERFAVGTPLIAIIKEKENREMIERDQADADANQPSYLPAPVPPGYLPPATGYCPPGMYRGKNGYNCFYNSDPGR
jgi:hypothetical protein